MIRKGSLKSNHKESTSVPRTHTLTGTNTTAIESTSRRLDSRQYNNPLLYATASSNSSAKDPCWYPHSAELRSCRSRSFPSYLILFVSLRILLYLIYHNHQQVLLTTSTSTLFEQAVHVAVLFNSTSTDETPQSLCTTSTSTAAATTTAAPLSPWWAVSYPSTPTSRKEDVTVTVIYPSYPHTPWPCFPVTSQLDKKAIHPQHLTQTISTDKGLVFIKLLKVAGSTAAGIHLRLADREAQRQRMALREQSHDNSSNETTISLSIQSSTDRPASSNNIIETLCLARFQHGMAFKMVQSDAWPHSWAPNDRITTTTTATITNDPDTMTPPWRRQRATRLRVWTMVREPTVRAMSQFFYSRMLQKGYEPTVDNMKTFLQAPYIKPFAHYRTWLHTNATRLSTDAWNERGRQLVHQLLTDFDFVGVTERFDESLVVLSFLWQIPLGDLLYLSSPKARGTWTVIPPRSHEQCFMMIEPPMSILQLPEMQTFLQSPEWRERVYWDQRIYQSAVSSLDATIASIGVGRVQERLQAFRAAQAVAAQDCPPDAYQPCYPNGTVVQSSQEESQCYLQDMGCGHACLDRVAESLSIHEYHE
jgi:hypothetical protein